jgi:hypothetical protein
MPKFRWRQRLCLEEIEDYAWAAKMLVFAIQAHKQEGSPPGWPSG